MKRHPQLHALHGRAILQLRPFLALGLVGNLLASSEPGERAYCVEGQLSYNAVVLKRQRTITFTACVKNCMWSITASSSDGKGTVFKQVFDGEVTTSSTWFPEELRNSTVRNDATLGIARVDTPDCMPPIGAGQIWLAYASACKLSSSTAGYLDPVWFINLDLRRNAFTLPAAWTRAEAPPSLPASVEYFDDPARLREALHLPLQDPPAKATTGADKLAAYKVSAFRQVGPFLLPEAWRFEAYGPGKDRPSLLYTYTGKLLKAREGVPAGAFDHAFGGKTAVQDERFVSPAEPAALVFYISTNKSVPDANSPQMIQAAMRANRSQVLGQSTGMPQPPRDEFRARRLLFLALTGALLVLPVGVAVARNRRCKFGSKHRK